MSKETQLYRYKHPSDPPCWIVDDFSYGEVEYYTLNTCYGLPIQVKKEVFHRDYEPVPATCEQESGWRPIADAPRDGTVIDVWTRRYERIASVKWKDGAWIEWGIDAFDCMAWVKIDVTPTHFMPLPQPPKAESCGKKPQVGFDYATRKPDCYKTTPAEPRDGE